MANVAFGAQSLGHGQQLRFGFGSEITNDKRNFLHRFRTHCNDILDQALHDRLASDGKQRLGNGQGVWS